MLVIGPCMGEPAVSGQAPVPPGFGILTVGSREEAEQIARDEPFHAMGWRRNSVMAWTPKFGSLIEVLPDATGPGSRRHVVHDAQAHPRRPDVRWRQGPYQMGQ